MEIWKPIPGYKGYEASSLGRLRSVPRIIAAKNRWGRVAQRSMKGRVLRPSKNSQGYSSLKLGHGSDTEMVHRLVWATFAGPIPKGQAINHMNGDRSDNRVENLEVCSQRENVIHALRTGLTARAHNGTALATESEVRAIRFFYVKKKGVGATTSLLAKIFRKTRGTIRDIATGETHSWVK